MIDWRALFVPSGSLIEIIIRGTVVYFVLLAALRVLIRRHVGSMSLMDLLLMVLIADAAQNAMAGAYRTITEGLVLCGTLLGWNYLLDWLAYLSPFCARILEPPPLMVVNNGKMIRRNMRAEFLTTEELMSQLRLQGIEDIHQVKRAYIESDGRISITHSQTVKDASPPAHHNKSLY
jgi:uncharacterized membrane protein YcaP (DUF421 family)